MKVENGNWERFEEWLRDLRSQLGAKAAPSLIFRGQADSSWHLSTTLERNADSPFSVRKYYELVCSIGPAAQTIAGIHAPDYQTEIAKKMGELNSFFDLEKYPSGKDYEYLVYLRHHGFPTPLLDWTRSPYVAAFFAFCDPQGRPNQRSIYVYCESPTGAKGGTVGEPTIRLLGPYVRSHPRHFRQQATYTICESLAKDRAWQFDSHESVFNGMARPTQETQDLLWRFDIPSDERTSILKRLNEFNLNAYSLFDSEEALFESLWNYEYLFRDK